jgi:hypothetical protein
MAWVERRHQDDVVSGVEPGRQRAATGVCGHGARQQEAPVTATGRRSARHIREPAGSDRPERLRRRQCSAAGTATGSACGCATLGSTRALPTGSSSRRLVTRNPERADEMPRPTAPTPGIPSGAGTYRARNGMSGSLSASRSVRRSLTVGTAALSAYLFGSASRGADALPVPARASGAGLDGS